MYIIYTFFFQTIYFFLIFFLFIFKERGKEGERVGEKQQWSPLTRPQLGPWLGITPAIFQSTGGHSIPWATLTRAHLLLSALGFRKVRFTRWLQTACLTVCLSFPIPLDWLTRLSQSHHQGVCVCVSVCLSSRDLQSGRFDLIGLRICWLTSFPTKHLHQPS